jgi:hypothetical protein
MDTWHRGSCEWESCGLYYEVLGDRKVVRVLALGIKDRDRVLFGGREIEVDP